MHAFMALFFYELVRDQIVFIWHAWATVVVHRWSLSLSAGPCLQHFFDDGEKKMLLLTKWCQRQILIIYLFVYLFIYLCLFICAVWFKIWALLLPLICLLVSATLYHCITSYQSRYRKNSEFNNFKDWFYIPVAGKLLTTMQYNTKALCIFVIINSYCSVLKKRVSFVKRLLKRRCQIGRTFP